MRDDFALSETIEEISLTQNFKCRLCYRTRNFVAYLECFRTITRIYSLNVYGCDSFFISTHVVLMSVLFCYLFIYLIFKENSEVGVEFPNFNFNASHHGDFVAIASEPLCLVGLDIVSCVIPWKETVIDFIHHFSSYFSSWEWDNIVAAGTCDDILVEFYR